MPLPVTVYRSTDVGAPQFDNTMTGFFNILRKCLVDGYGTKLPLGWTIPYEDVSKYKMVIRNSTANGGSGGYCQFMPATVGSNTSSVIHFKCAHYMGGVDNWLRPQVLRSNFLTSSSVNNWVLIGTSRGFYFQRLYVNQLDHAGHSQYSNAMFVGDIHSYHNPDAGCFMATANNQSSDDVSPTSQDGITYIKDGFSLGSVIDVDGNINNNTEYSAYAHGILSANHPDSYGLTLDPPSINFTLSKVIIGISVANSTDRYNVICNYSVTRPRIRGELPGFYIIPESNIAKDISYPHTPIINGIQHYPLVNSLGASVWVNVESWYD